MTGMIIVSIAAKTVQEAKEQIQYAQGDAVELRLDALDQVNPNELKQLAPLRKIIMTDRRHAEGGLKAQTDTQRFEDIHSAIFAKPWAVDIELASPRLFRRKLIKAAHEQGVLVISSYHNFKRTPPAEKLDEMVRQALEESDYAKIVCLTQNEADITALLDLVRRYPGKVAAFGLGEKAAHTRILSLKLGAPFGYAKGQDATSPGQLTVEEMKKRLAEITKEKEEKKIGEKTQQKIQTQKKEEDN